MSFTFEAPTKDPSAVLNNHAMSWVPWLREGESIVGTPAVVSNRPDVLVVDQVSHSGGIVSWRVSGGINRKEYLVTVTVSTNQGRTDERTVRYQVENR